MKSSLKKLALTLALTFGITVLFSSIQTSATENNTTLQKLDNYKEIIHDDGSITRITEIPELNIRDEVTFNKITGDVIINGNHFNISSISNAEKYKENKIMTRSSVDTWVFQVRDEKAVPIGTTVSAGLSLLSIWTGVPSSKLAQTFLSFSGLAIGSTLNDQLKVVIYQYRSKYQIDGRYKYKHSYLFQWKGKTFYKTENELFTERP